MDKTTLLELVEEQAETIQLPNNIYFRNGLEDIKAAIESPQIVVISGIRRSGKSTLLKQILHTHFPKKASYFTFEDERLLNFTASDFNILYEALTEFYGEQTVFFFDEIQNVIHWELFVRRLHDRGIKIFISGSNASLLSKELGTRLTGRIVLYTLYPFSFSEFIGFTNPTLQFKKPTNAVSRGLISKAFSHYLKCGGMPLFVIHQERFFLTQVYEDILYRDIITRYKINDEKSVRELSLYLISNIGSFYSYNKIKGMLQIGSVNTVKNYIHYLENTYLFFSLYRFNYSLKQQQLAPKKIYCIDPGLIHALSFSFSENMGHILENIAFLELKRRQYEVYYYHTNSGSEVDFIVREGSKIILLIQVCTSLTNDSTYEREVSALWEAMDETQLLHGIILTQNMTQTIKKENKNIIVMPLYQWILEPT